MANFFLDSWKVNAFNRSNYSTCQSVQLVLIAAQLYFALISSLGGGMSPECIVLFLTSILASGYSFFSPLRLTAVDMLQSNASQIGLLALGTAQILGGEAGIPFYVLYALMALDTFLSCQTFFNEH